MFLGGKMIIPSVFVYQMLETTRNIVDKENLVLMVSFIPQNKYVFDVKVKNCFYSSINYYSNLKQTWF